MKIIAGEDGDGGKISQWNEFLKDMDPAKRFGPQYWSWSFQLPTGCTPFVMAGYTNMTIDVCKFKPMIHDLMSMIWLISTFFGILYIARETM